MIGKGIYTVSEAARLTHVHPQTIRRWLRGYTYPVQDGARRSPRVVFADYGELDGALSLSFRDLIEIRFVAAFRDYGVTWKTLRAASVNARELFDTTHPFSTRKFRTDGKRVFADMVEEADSGPDEKLLDIVRDQYAFRRILAPHLYQGIEIADDRAIRWWHLNRKVVLDPERAFGQPIVSREGVPTATLAKALAVEGSVESVASWFEVKTSSVTAAAEFETLLAA